jgi:hypothetical protein
LAFSSACEQFVACLYPVVILKCLISVKVIQQTILAVIQKVKAVWLLRMDPMCRTPESAHAHHKFKGIPESYAVRSQLLSFMPIEIGQQRARRAMVKMQAKFQK